jgi:hypothetical protein
MSKGRRVGAQKIGPDDDDSGYLDEEEVVQFCAKLGLQFTAEEACQALDEMEQDETRDGKVRNEFGWWTYDSASCRWI